MECDNCGATAPRMHRSPVIEGGWELNWLQLGYYSGFTDCIPDNEDDDPSDYTVRLCHDCCVKVVEVLPVLKKHVRGGHPFRGEAGAPPCCPYTWKITHKDDGESESYLATEDGRWEKV